MLYEEYQNLSIYGMLERMERQYRGKPLFSYMAEDVIETVDYTHFLGDICRMGEYLKRLGMDGKYVVVDSRNTYEQIVSMFASMIVGAVAALLNFGLPWEDISDAMDRIKPSLIIYDEEDKEEVLAYGKQHRIPCMPCLPYKTACKEEKYAGKSVKEVLADGDGQGFSAAERKASDPAMILMTSGSTSKSKLVVLPQAAFLPHSEVLTERSIFVLPMYHIAALNILINDMARGTHICLSNLKYGFRDIAWFRPADVFAVPAFVSQLVKKSKNQSMDIRCFKNISSGGAPQSLDTVEYLNSMGIFSMSLYGATETAGMVDYSTPDVYRYGSVGKPGPWNEIRISDEGEILVKGANVMLEYLGDPEATAQVLKDGWYYSGDVGYLDTDGFLFVTGRVRNVIILSNGENVSPEAVEASLIYCNEIEEVQVCGKDDKILAQIWCGETANEDTRERIRAFIQEHNSNVPTFQRIRKIVFRDRPFEKTASGKMKRS